MNFFWFMFRFSALMTSSLALIEGLGFIEMVWGNSGIYLAGVLYLIILILSVLFLMNRQLDR